MVPAALRPSVLGSACIYVCFKLWLQVPPALVFSFKGGLGSAGGKASSCSSIVSVRPHSHSMSASVSSGSSCLSKELQFSELYWEQNSVSAVVMSLILDPDSMFGMDVRGTFVLDRTSREAAVPEVRCVCLGPYTKYNAALAPALPPLYTISTICF